MYIDREVAMAEQRRNVNGTEPQIMATLGNHQWKNYLLEKTRRSGMADNKKKLFYLKNIKIQSQVAKNHRSIPLAVQITLRKSSTNWPSLLSSSHQPNRAWAQL